MTVVAVGLEWTAWFKVVAAEASLAVSAVLDVVFADSGVAAGSSAVCLAHLSEQQLKMQQFFPPLAYVKMRGMEYVCLFHSQITYFVLLTIRGEVCSSDDLALWPWLFLSSKKLLKKSRNVS